MKILALVLIALGAAALYFRGVPYTHREKLVDLGPIQATAERDDTLPVPPWVGGGLVAVGAVMLLSPSRRRR